MTRPIAAGPTAPQRPAWGRWRPELPSWLMSLVLHLLVLLAIGLTLRLAPRQGTSAERTAEVGIALKHQDGESEYYETGETSGGSSATSNDNRGPPLDLDDVLADESPSDPTLAALPAPMNVIGPGALGDNGIPNAASLSEGPPARVGPIGGQGRATLFGITGEGWKFVYVFDRSDSMNWHHQKPLRAAKKELIDSLQTLESVHQFQIIFYNEKPMVFNPSGHRHKLAFATEQNKRNARTFVQGILAGGATEHGVALMQAIKLQPDVIFLLTDADPDTPLPAAQVYEILRRTAGITIHTVEFGSGPQREAENFLVRLARQTGGQHVYVDISKLP